MIRVDRDKLVSAFGYAETTPMLTYAVNGFLSSGADQMEEDLFGTLVAECGIHPEDLMPDPKLPDETKSPWSVKIVTDGDRLKMTVYHDGEEVVYGKSYVQESDDLGMIQAISYAAHICYKMVQQRQM